MFLVRLTFWLALVIAFIPANPEDLQGDQRAVTTGELLNTARLALRDLSQFCQRNPDACRTGQEVVAQFGAKARTGARYVYTFLDERFGGDDSDPTLTGAVGK